MATEIITLTTPCTCIEDGLESRVFLYGGIPTEDRNGEKTVGGFKAKLEQTGVSYYVYHCMCLYKVNCTSVLTTWMEADALHR